MATIKVIPETDLREPQTYAAVAAVRVTRAELRDRGIELRTPPDDGTWDEASPIQEALLETPAGDQPLLIWYLICEELPEETGGRPCAQLRAPVSTADAEGFVRRTLDALDLPQSRAEWVVPSEFWPPTRG